MAIPRPNADPAFAAYTMTSGMAARLSFNPFDPPPEYRAIVDKADLLAAVVVGHLFARFMDQTEDSTLLAFYGFGCAVLSFDLAPAEDAIEMYLGDDEEAELATDFTLRSIVRGFVHYDLIQRFIAERKAAKANTETD